MTPLVLATSNPHKVAELRAIFARRSISVVGLADIEGPAAGPEPEEHGTTFEQNATIKALAYAERTGCLCIADDSGLEVDVLGGAPGVISSHYCTDGREAGLTRAERDRRNNERLLRELEGIPPDGRGARFVCVMALTRPGKVIHRSTGECGGRIGLPGQVPRGDQGFGYDPLFLVAPGFTRTMAELEPEVKNGLSHRGAAARAMASWVREHRSESGWG